MTDDLKVTATDPPGQAVRVEVGEGGACTVAVLAAGNRTLHHVVVLRGSEVQIVPDIQPEYPTMWTDPADLVLATIEVPPHTGEVQDWQITDLRPWRS